MAYDWITAPSSGHVAGAVYYAQAVLKGTGKIWDGTQLSAAPAYADTAIAMTEINSMGAWGFTFAAAMPPGIYLILFRLRAGGAPAATDNVIDSTTLQKTWMG